MARHGENIHKRSDGRWEARAITRDINDKKIIYFYASSYLEVKQKRDEWRAECKSNKLLAPLPINKLADSWLTDIVGRVKESTYTRYYRIVNNFILSYFSEQNISDIEIEDIEVFRNTLSISLATKTVSDIVGTLRQLLKYAKRYGYDTLDFTELSTIKKSVKRVVILPTATVSAIENALFAENSNFSVGLLLSLHAGVRIGELCGLRFEDYDKINGVIHINRTVERIADLNPKNKSKTKIVMSAPKSESSKRIIPLPLHLRQLLDSFEGIGHYYILTNSSKCSEPHTLYMKYKSFLKRHKLGDYSFHTLRHTFATTCVNKGFDIKSLSEILGHSDVATTLRYYVHPTLEQKRVQMEKLSFSNC